MLGFLFGASECLLTATKVLSSIATKGETPFTLKYIQARDNMHMHHIAMLRLENIDRLANDHDYHIRLQCKRKA